MCISFGPKNPSVCSWGYAVHQIKHNQRHNMKKYNYNLHLFLESRPHPCNLPLQTQMKVRANLLYFRNKAASELGVGKLMGVGLWGRLNCRAEELH